LGIDAVEGREVPIEFPEVDADEDGVLKRAARVAQNAADVGPEESCCVPIMCMPERHWRAFAIHTLRVCQEIKAILFC